MSERAPLLQRLRVPLLASLAIGVSVAAVWIASRRGEDPVAPGETAPAAPQPPPAAVPALPEGQPEDPRAEIKAFVAGLEKMLAKRVADGAPREEGEPVPLPLPESLQDASEEEKHAYYVELLRHGEGMIELNREHMSEEDLAEAEAVLAALRERLAGLGDAGTP